MANNTLDESWKRIICFFKFNVSNFAAACCQIKIEIRLFRKRRKRKVTAFLGFEFIPGLFGDNPGGIGGDSGMSMERLNFIGDYREILRGDSGGTSGKSQQVDKLEFSLEFCAKNQNIYETK